LLYFSQSLQGAMSLKQNLAACEAIVRFLRI